MSHTLIHAGTVITMNDEGTIYEPGYLRLGDGRIVEVGAGHPARQAGDEQIVDLSGRVLMPGLVNTHTHSPMVLFRGLAEGHSLLTFEGWFNAIRVWEEQLDPTWIAPAVAVSCGEMIRTGTTTFADQYFHMGQVLPVVRDSGLRAALAYGVVEMGEPEVRRRELAAAEEFLAAAQGDTRLDGWLGPHALFVDNSLPAIEAQLELAERYEAGLHIHLSTSGEEDRYCREHFGVSAVEQMQRLGVLERRVLAAHCLTVPEADFPRLAASEFTAVICASACMRSGAQAAPAPAMAAAGLNLALGTDNVSNNNSYDLFSELRTTAKLMAYREQRPAPFSAEQVLRMATRGGARALGLEDQIGSLETGKQADLIALDGNGVGWGPRAGQNLYTALVYAVDGQQVTDSMVEGRWLLREGSWQTVDYEAACAELERAHSALRQHGKAAVRP